MEDTHFWSLAAKYLAGEASEQEGRALHVLLASDPVRRNQFAEAVDVWEHKGKQDVLRLDVVAAWNTLEGSIEREGAGSKPASGTTRSDRTRRRTGRGRPAARRRWRFAAGSVVLVLVAVVAIFFLSEPQGDVIATARGERLAVTLADGTRVHLNAESRLSLLHMRDRGTREVYLEGEAFFEVAHAEDRPFLVRTNEGVIRVVGTAFNVHAYAGDKHVRVTVAEGAVALLVRPSMHPDSSVVLRPRQLGVMDDQRLSAVDREVDLASHLAWRDGRLVFENAPFPEVVRRLERWYDLHIDSASLDSVDGLNAVFVREAADVVIGDIAVALGLNYERNGDQVRFYRTPTP